MATTHTPATDNWLIFRIGRVACAVPALAVDTILLPPEHLTATPGADAGTPGMFHHGHETVAAIDLRHRFGLDPVDLRRGRLLLGHLSGRPYAFWVEEIVGLAGSGEVSPAPLPPELPHNVFTAALLYRKEIVLCSDLTRLLLMRDAGILRQMVRPPEPEPAPEPPPEPAAKPAVPAAEPAGTASGNVPVTASTARPATAPPPAAAATARPMPARTSDMRPPRAVTPAKLAQRQRPVPPTPPPSPRRTPLGETPPAPPVTVSPGAPPVTAPSVPETSAPAAPPPEQSSALPLAALVVVLLAGGVGGWFALDLWLTPPLRPPAAPPAPHVPVPPPAPAAEPLPAAAPPARPAVTPTVIAAAPGIEVQQEGRDITIVIDRQEAKTAAVEALPAETPPPPAPASDPVLPTQAPAAAAAPATPTPPTVRVHVVVKGDTLWAIAERYLNDPWRYRELARSSRIRNPDLIYPGQKVRIVIR